MELETLLNNQGWEESELDFSTRAIEADIHSKVQDRIGDLFSHYYKTIGLNLLFLIGFSSIWFVLPVWETLIPIGIIATCYIYLIGNVVYHLWKYERPDPALPLPDLIRAMLAFNQRMHRQVCDYQAIVMSACGLAGFMLGVLFRSGTMANLIQKPIGIFSALLFTGLIYYFTKKGWLSSLNKTLNPRYTRAKTYLEQQLAELEEGANSEE